MEKKQPGSSEEIDLLYFFRPVANGARRVWGYGTNYLHLLAYNRFLFAAILVLGAIGGYALRYFIKPTYKTEAIFVSDMLPASYCTNLLGNLNELRRPGNIPLLAKELNISTDAAYTIRGISPYVVAKDTFVFEKWDSSMSVFRVGLELTDISNVEAIQNGLIGYLENNPYIRRRKEARVENIKTQLAELDVKIRELDSLRAVVTRSIVPRSQGQGIILGEPINPVSIYQAEIGYRREQLNMRERLSTIEHIEILQPFFKLNERNSPDYDKLMMYAFIASFLFALAIIPLIGREPKVVVRP